mgnify:CR=1 FL=1
MSQGTRITHARLRDSSKRVDPEGVEKRRLKKGKVRAHLDIYEAFEVVQMDGHFKLPWGLHVVGAIDVATRMPILIKVVDNKHSMVMLHLYREAVRSSVATHRHGVCA